MTHSPLDLSCLPACYGVHPTLLVTNPPIFCGLSSPVLPFHHPAIPAPAGYNLFCLIWPCWWRLCFPPNVGSPYKVLIRHQGSNPLNQKALLCCTVLSKYIVGGGRVLSFSSEFGVHHQNLQIPRHTLVNGTKLSPGTTRKCILCLCATAAHNHCMPHSVHYNYTSIMMSNWNCPPYHYSYELPPTMHLYWVRLHNGSSRLCL